MKPISVHGNNFFLTESEKSMRMKPLYDLKQI